MKEAMVRRRTRGTTPPRIGIEHEFQLFGIDGSVDARVLLPTLALDGRRLDPGDAHAVRCRWGGVITADGREAEIATPPIRLSTDGLGTVIQLADAGRAALANALDPTLSLHGYSTHLNVEIDDRVVARAARTVAERMAPAIMLLLDDRDSPGLIVRPRHARLEIGGEFAVGRQLLEALVMTCGVALVAERAVHDRQFRRHLPPILDVRLVPTQVRFGWYVDRRASGDDLYSSGRACRFRTRRGAEVTADDILHQTWSIARCALEERVDASLLRLVDERIADGSPLPADTAVDRELPATTRPSGSALAAWPAHLVDGWRRGTIDIDVESATWHKVIMRVTDGAATRWVTIPGEDTDSFVGSLQCGELDAWLQAQLASTHIERVSRSRAAARRTKVPPGIVA